MYFGDCPYLMMLFNTSTRFGLVLSVNATIWNNNDVNQNLPHN